MVGDEGRGRQSACSTPVCTRGRRPPSRPRLAPSESIADVCLLDAEGGEGPSRPGPTLGRRARPIGRPNLVIKLHGQAENCPGRLGCQLQRRHAGNHGLPASRARDRSLVCTRLQALKHARKRTHTATAAIAPRCGVGQGGGRGDGSGGAGCLQGSWAVHCTSTTRRWAGLPGEADCKGPDWRDLFLLRVAGAASAVGRIIHQRQNFDARHRPRPPSRTPPAILHTRRPGCPPAPPPATSGADSLCNSPIDPRAPLGRQGYPHPINGRGQRAPALVPSPSAPYLSAGVPGTPPP